MNYYLLLFIIYIPVYFALLLLIGSKHKNYSAHNSIVSELASSPKPWGILFNISTSVYGLLSLVLPYSLIYKFGLNIQNILGALLIMAIGIGTFLVGAFPLTKYSLLHNKIANFIFTIIIVTGLVFIPVFNQPDKYPFIMRQVNFGILVTGVIFAVFTLKHKQTNPIWEWITLFGTFTWNICLSVSLL